MKVFVAGGTGFIGTVVCRRLLDGGHEVTAAARDPDDADLPEAVSRTELDVTDEEDVPAAVAGHDAVVHLVSLSPLYQPPHEGAYEEVIVNGTHNLVDAARAADVERFVYLSGLGVDPDGPTAFLRAKGRAEELVRGRRNDWVILRPSIVFGDGAEILSFTRRTTTPYVTALPGGGRTRFQPIWVGDLAGIILETVDDPGRAGETYELGGPEVLSLADIARAIHAADGRSLRIVPVPMSIASLGLTLAGPVPFVPFGPDQARSLRLDNVPAENDVAQFGMDPAELTTFGEYLEGW